MDDFEDTQKVAAIAKNLSDGDILDTIISYIVWDDYSILQPVWDLRKGYEHYIASPLFPIITSVGFYFLWVLPFTFLDLFGKNWKWIQKYKIQPDKEVTWDLVSKAIGRTMWNNTVYILPISIAQWIWTPPFAIPEKAPGLFEFLWHHLAALAIFDFQYWVWHLVHHKVRFLYRHVHAIHHHYHCPNSWVTQYLHPWELISVGTFTCTSPWLLQSHTFTQSSFQIFAIVVSVDAHCGYDFPFLPHHWFVFWGGSIKHDMHHQRPLTNFEPFYNYLDKLFGFECPGQMAGGYKPKKLLDWEKARKDEQKKKTGKQSDYLVSTDYEASAIPISQGGC